MYRLLHGSRTLREILILLSQLSFLFNCSQRKESSVAVQAYNRNNRAQTDVRATYNYQHRVVINCMHFRVFFFIILVSNNTFFFCFKLFSLKM